MKRFPQLLISLPKAQQHFFNSVKSFYLMIINTLHCTCCAFHVAFCL